MEPGAAGADPELMQSLQQAGRHGGGRHGRGRHQVREQGNQQSPRPLVHLPELGTLQARDECGHGFQHKQHLGTCAGRSPAACWSSWERCGAAMYAASGQWPLRPDLTSSADSVAFSIFMSRTETNSQKFSRM